MFFVIVFVAFLAYVAYKLFLLIKFPCDSITASKSLNANFFQNKVVVITGASSGIGKQLAVKIDNYNVGAKLVLVARSKDKLERLAGKLQNAKIVVADLAELQKISTVYQCMKDCFGDVDVLINNAGISQRSLSHQATFVGVAQPLIQLDLLSPIALTKLAVRDMMERDSGSIVFVNSVAGLISAPLRASYCAAKHGLRAYADVMRAELVALGHANIAVSTICPGSVQTPIAENALSDNGQKYGIDDNKHGQNLDEFCDWMLIAVTNELNEAWITDQGLQKVGIYLRQYFPSLFLKVLEKKTPQYLKKEKFIE